LIELSDYIAKNKTETILWSDHLLIKTIFNKILSNISSDHYKTNLTNGFLVILSDLLIHMTKEGYLKSNEDIEDIHSQLLNLVQVFCI
jgi:hypothetical protein